MLAATGCGGAAPSTPSPVGPAIDAAAAARPATTLLTPAGQSWWDPEVMQSGADSLETWQNERAEVWIAGLDPRSGLVVPGSERRLGVGAAPLLETYNGPERGLDSGGSRCSARVARAGAALRTRTPKEAFAAMAREVREGLSRQPLPELPEYESTRTETEVLAALQDRKQFLIIKT